MFDANILQLLFGFVLLGAFANYAAWTRIRVVIVKQELFKIRDSLWDKACELDRLNDEAYRATRMHLNNCIRVAHLLSIQTILAVKPDSPNPSPVISSTDPRMQEAIDEAYQKCSALVKRYLLRYRLTGLALSCMIGMTEAVGRWASEWVYSDAPEFYLNSQAKRL